jgi:alkylhydroperoxidase/carboxymuconolactone decarboxylase family protein YurZ
MSSTKKRTANSATEAVRESGRWAKALDLLHEADPAWTEIYSRVAIDPWVSGSLSRKDIQLIAVGLAASITNLDASALRRHIRAALHAGASRAEILEVLKMAAILALHSMSLGAPMLLEEATAAGVTLSASKARETEIPVVNQMKAMGLWNQAWDAFYGLDPAWTEQFVAAGAGFYINGVLTPKFVELISIAFDAAITHMYAPGTRRHIRAALALGASVTEIMDVLKICVSSGANALDFAVPILSEEAETYEGRLAANE